MTHWKWRKKNKEQIKGSKKSSSGSPMLNDKNSPIAMICGMRANFVCGRNRWGSENESESERERGRERTKWKSHARHTEIFYQCICPVSRDKNLSSLSHTKYTRVHTYISLKTVVLGALSQLSRHFSITESFRTYLFPNQILFPTNVIS